MSDSTQFNADLVGAEHLAVEDDAPTRDIRTRRAVGNAIKTMLYADVQSLHAKGVDAVNLEPRWALSFSLNDEPENLAVIPPIDESLKDKMIILLARSVPRHVPSGMTERQWLEDVLKRELPAFLFSVDSAIVPEDMRDPRSGVAGWQHPDVLDALNAISPEERLLEMIDGLGFDPVRVGSIWVGSALSLEGDLRGKYASEVGRMTERNPGAIGLYLGRLSVRHPKRIVRRRTGANNLWRISAPGVDVSAVLKSD